MNHYHGHETSRPNQLMATISKADNPHILVHFLGLWAYPLVLQLAERAFGQYLHAHQCGNAQARILKTKQLKLEIFLFLFDSWQEKNSIQHPFFFIRSNCRCKVHNGEIYRKHYLRLFMHLGKRIQRVILSQFGKKPRRWRYFVWLQILNVHRKIIELIRQYLDFVIILPGLSV